jgi:hypothetical protein
LKCKTKKKKHIRYLSKVVTAVNVEEIHSVLEEDRATKVLFAASNSYYHYKCGCPRIEKTNQHATQLAFAERRNGLIRHVPLRDYDLADFRRGIFEILQQFGDLAAQVEVIFEDCLKFGTPEPVSSLEKKKAVMHSRNQEGVIPIPVVILIGLQEAGQRRGSACECELVRDLAVRVRRQGSWEILLSVTCRRSGWQFFQYFIRALTGISGNAVTDRCNRDVLDGRNRNGWGYPNCAKMLQE